MSEKTKILIGYDGSGCADAAIDDLQRAGLPREAEALVLSVTEVWLPPPPPSSYEIVEAAQAAESPADLQQMYMEGSPAMGEARALATRAAERLRNNFPEWTVRADAACGSPASELIKSADEWKPDLIVVGSHGRTALGRFVMGSVSQKVLTEARCSVRIARGRVEVDSSPVRIVIGMDGSPGAEAAARAVAARPWPRGSEARLIIVDDPLLPTSVGRFMPPVAKWVEESNEVDRAWVQKLTAAAVEQLRVSKLIVSPEIKEGDTKRVLIQCAEEWGADCIFVGSTGFSNRFERFLLGSVSAAVAARAHCSVEVVREEKTT